MLKKLSMTLAFLIALGGSVSCYSKMQNAKAYDLDVTSYMIQNMATGKYLTVQNGGINDTNVCQYEADGVADYNIWHVTQEASGVYMLCSATDNLYLTTGENGSLIVTKKEEENVYQKFNFEQEPDSDIFKITAGGWYVTPQADSIDIIMTDDASCAEWRFISVNDRGRVGDVNHDGIVNIYDLIFAKRIVKQQDFSDIMKASRADVNADGILDTEDVKLLQQFLSGKIEKFPAFMVELKPNTIYPAVDMKIPDPEIPTEPTTEPANPTEQITLSDMPSEYQEAAEWIWQNRCVYEGSTTRRNTIFDQIYAGEGTINFVVRWQSYKTITYEQRQQFEKLASDCINAWNDWLKNYDGWKYDHIDVKVVGWAVLDKSCLLDLHDDEIVYDNLISDYDSQYDTSNGYEIIPDKLPSAPSELSRFDHFEDVDYMYPDGLDKRFDMYLWATQGFPAIGGAGGDWGQRLSDDAYINMLDGTNIHVLEHEIGHGFGITDFYGENGTNSGPPPTGFPDDGTSIMMAGSSTKITDFDGWLLRYLWSQIKEEEGRF